MPSLGVAELKTLADAPVAEAPRATAPRGDASLEDEDSIDAVDAIDLELFPLFEEEAQDLLPKLAAQLREHGGDIRLALGIERAAELMTGRVTGRWEDIVTFARARLLEWQDDPAGAEAAYPSKPIQLASRSRRAVPPTSSAA